MAHTPETNGYPAATDHDPRLREKTTYWRHLANTIEGSVRGGDAALRQISLTVCYIQSTNLLITNASFYR